MVRLSLVLLLIAQPAAAQWFFGAAAPPTCTQVGATQTFGSDPFGTTWTADTDDADCQVGWNATGVIERTRGAAAPACDETNAVARFDTDTGTLAGCACAQLTATDDGLLGNGGWSAPALVFWSQSGDAGDNYMAIGCDNDTTCGQMLFFSSIAQDASACTTFGAFTIGNYIGVCWDDAPGPTLVDVKVFNLGASCGNPSSWPVPTCSFSTCPFGQCDTTGQRAGVWLRSNAPGVNAFVRYDNFKLFAGCTENVVLSINDIAFDIAQDI